VRPLDVGRRRSPEVGFDALEVVPAVELVDMDYPLAKLPGVVDCRGARLSQGPML
jgi:hypothetical protein